LPHNAVSLAAVLAYEVAITHLLVIIPSEKVLAPIIVEATEVSSN